MTNDELLHKLKRMIALKDMQKELRTELAKFCVEKLGVPQDTINQINVVDYLDGYLKGKGVWK